MFNSKRFVKYTIRDLRKDFPNDDVCLEYLFEQFYGHLPDFNKYYRIKGVKEYVHSVTGQHISPLANTIFHKSRTPLTVWFEVIYKFSNSRNGVSAMEVMRDFGMTYKCAWRICKQIRTLFEDEAKAKLNGNVEADETYMGGKEKNKHLAKKTKNTQGRSNKTKTPVLGTVKRKTKTDTAEVRAKVVTNTASSTITPFIKENVEIQANLFTDEYRGYNKVSGQGYKHDKVNHGIGQYAVGDTHTNTIEGFWSILKNGIVGTYKMVSTKYLQSYVNEFAFRYNHDHSQSHLFNSILNTRLRNNLVV